MQQITAIISTLLLFTLAACSENTEATDNNLTTTTLAEEADNRSTIWDVLNQDQKSTPVKVNRYIWQASLEVLDFMPVKIVDPFSGLIVMDYGKPPGGKTEYQATVYVMDPALDARTLRIALRTRNGPADAETMRALEDAVLSRARQIREIDGTF